MTGRPPPAALAALAAFAACAWLFWPGYVSFDTAHQWFQVRHGEFSDHHPPLMALLWRATEPLLPGPGGLLLVQLALWWSALAVAAASIFRDGRAQVAAVVLAGAAPPLFGLLGHVWKDVLLMAALALAAALMLADAARPKARRGLLLAAAACLLAVAALRHNGLAAALPLLPWLVWRAAAGRLRGLALLVPTLAAALVLAVLAQLPARHPAVQRVEFWPTLALWDLAAVSVATGRMQVPQALRKGDVTVDDLRPHLRPDNNVPLFAPDLLKLSLLEPYDEVERQALRQAWLGLPWREPGAYAGHRWRLARIQVGLPPAGLGPAQAFSPGHVALADNPPLAIPDDAVRQGLARLLAGAAGHPLVAPWPWLLAALLLAALFWRRRAREPRAWLGLALVASAWAYALPLAVLAASAELRYLGPSLALVALATMLALAPPAPAPGARRGRP